jgi:hypothetical protein
MKSKLVNLSGLPVRVRPIDLSGLRLRGVLHGLRFRPKRPPKSKITHWFTPQTKKIEAIDGK